PQKETVTNTGAGTLVISAVTIGGTNFADFATAADTCTGAAVAPSASCTLSLKFTPFGIGARTASLNFVDNAPGSPQSVPLNGTGSAPLVGFTPSSLSFAGENLETTSAAQMLTISNGGTTDLLVTSVTLGGANDGDFAKASDSCSGATVTAGN